MQIILNNPYRLVGLLVGATAKEQDRQIKRLKQFIEAEQTPQEDFSFPTLGSLNRTLENVTEAASKLNLDSDKMNASLFWFYNGSHTDEPAFNAIKEADLDQVINIWSKLTASSEVTQRNASAYNNLSTLYLSGILEGTNTDEFLLEQGVSLKLKFLESDCVKDFKALATDETYKTTKTELQLLFLNQLQSQIDKIGKVSSTIFIDILNKLTFSAKDDFLKGFVQKPIAEIERQIEESKTKRKANKANALKIGQALHKQTSEYLKQLKAILGASNNKYSSIADKVANEILQCGIDYFKYKRDNTENSNGIPKEHSTYTGGTTNENFAEASLNLFHKAKTLAIGNISKQRCQENTENLQEYINEKPEREKQAKILVDFEKLKSLIDEYNEKNKTISNAKQLLVSTTSYLNNVKSVLGSNDELYLGLSSRIASDALGMCVAEVNKLQDKIGLHHDQDRKRTIIILLQVSVENALAILSIIDSMDLQKEFRIRYTKNEKSLLNLKMQLNSLSTVNEKESSSIIESGFNFSDNFWWIGGIIGFIIGACNVNFANSFEKMALMGVLTGIILGWIIGKMIKN